MVVPPQWAPKNATERSKNLWLKSITSRAGDLLYASPQRIREYTLGGFESFTGEEYRYAIQTGFDALPGLQSKLALNNGFVERIARAAVRNNWTRIQETLMAPSVLIAQLTKEDPVRGAPLNTVEGQQWFNWTCFHTLTFLRQWAKIRGDDYIRPPSTPCPIRHTSDTPCQLALAPPTKV